MSNFITKDELAKIAISKNLIKEYKSSNSERTVYLNDGTEFQIYLKNPYQSHLGIKISVNNKSIGNMLVLRPGQSFWLDRFVNENSKFLFSTYEIENTAEMKYATNNNGKVKIEFYHEREEKPIQVYTNYPKVDWTYYNGGNAYNINTITCQNDFKNGLNSNVHDCATSACYYSASTTSATIGEIPTASSATTARYDSDVSTSRKKGVSRSLDATIETGRVEKGSMSNQEFEYCDIDFDYYPFKTENIQILPNSRKQIRVEETRRKYCSQCGKKVSPKDKFCSNCGAKLT
jgi:hypothetical protein